MSPLCRARNCLRFVLTVLKALIFRFKQGGAVSAEPPYHLTQHATRCSDSSGQAQEYLIARHAAVETETVLVQISLELGAPSVICSLKECFQITDYLVYPIPFAIADAGKGLSPYWTDVSVKTNNVASYQSESPMPKSRGLEPHQNTRFGKCLRQAHPVSLPFCYSLYLLKSIQSTAGRLLSP